MALKNSFVFPSNSSFFAKNLTVLFVDSATNAGSRAFL
jgi:hypothetical protein